MKFLQLKRELSSGIKPAFLISGNDRYLCYAALNQIKDKLAIAYPQMNEVILAGESTTKEEIVRSASIFPFCDNYRLVQINDFSSKTKTKKDSDELLEYLKHPMKESVIIFFNLEKNDALKPYLDYICEIDCDKLDFETLSQTLRNKLNKEGVEIDGEALDKLILYCNNDMARINGELTKLESYCSGRKIETSDVETLVVEDKEYKVFELAEFIARGEKYKALDLVYSLTNGKSGGGFSILTPLYNNYRRALYVSINKDKTDNELASFFGVAPYAVKMTRNQVRFFSPRKLKEIVDLLYNVDRNIKMGKIKEDVAIKTATLNILKIRG